MLVYIDTGNRTDGEILTSLAPVSEGGKKLSVLLCEQEVAFTPWQDFTDCCAWDSAWEWVHLVLSSDSGTGVAADQQVPEFFTRAVRWLPTATGSVAPMFAGLVGTGKC